MTSLNPASQPFFPSSTLSRKDSGMGGFPANAVSGDTLQGDRASSSFENDDYAGAIGTPSQLRTPVSNNGALGAASEAGLLRSNTAGGNGTPVDLHQRIPSSLSSYQSARSSPSPPSSSGRFAQTTEATSFDTGAYGGIPAMVTTSSPPESLGSRSTSASREDDTNGVRAPTSTARPIRQESNEESSGDSPHPLSFSGFSDRSGSSFPAIESFLRRERGGVAGALGSSALDGTNKNGDGLGGFLNTGLKWDDIPNQGTSPNAFNRAPSNRSSNFGPIGKPTSQANDLNIPQSNPQGFNSAMQSPIGPISRSMSLGLPIGSGNHQPPAGPVRKSSFATFEQATQPQPPKSPLPNSFLSYNLGAASGSNHNLSQPHSSANVTPTTAGFGTTHHTNMFNGTSMNTENMSSSPSSVRSSAGGIMAEGLGPQSPFDLQAKSSPFINDLLDRLIRCEYSTSQIQKEIGDINRKMNILLDRVITISAKTEAGGTNGLHADQSREMLSASPLAGNSVTPTAGTPGVGAVQPSHFYNIPNGSSTSSLALQSPTPANNKDNSRDEEIRQLNHRIATLTTSVAQLLQAQSHNQIQNMNAGLNAPSPVAFGGGYNPIASGGGNSGLNMGMNVPSLTGTPDLPTGPLNAMGPRGSDLGLPNRPSPRAPIPVRTWSSSSVEMGLGMGNMQAPVRQDSLPGGMRDKRKSVITLGRRDSSGTIMDMNSDWTGGSSRGDSGPVITKWEQLNLSPELLRSIAKYGVGPPNKIQQRALPFLLRGSDIIAQAPPTQERIAAYVIPAIHVALTNCVGKPAPNKGPIVVIISTTVDQATQAQRMIRDLGGPIGVRSALGVGTGGDVIQELRLLQQSMPHILCGTPQKLHALFSTANGLTGSEVRLLVLDEVDQLIARNLHEYVFNIVKTLPPPRSRPLSGTLPSNGSLTPVASPSVTTPGGGFSPFDAPGPGGLRRMSSAYVTSPTLDPSMPIERQTALFSNTVPQDVLNLANTIQLREPVRVLVRRDGNVQSSETSHGSRGLRQFYLYLAFTGGGGGARPDPNSQAPGSSLGIIGSGRGSVLNSAETAQAREWKLDALTDLFDDVDIPQAIVHVGGMSALDAVVYKLAAKNLDPIPLHNDMNTASKTAALNRFRGAGSSIRPGVARVLVVYDVQVKAPDVFQIPLVINYDLPKAVEEYAHRVAPAISNNYLRSGIVINFVTATGGDVEMLRSIECFYKIKCPEVPMSLRDIL